MNAEEMGELLASAAIFDNRTVGDADILAWMRAIGDLSYDDADAAVAAHYGETTERLMPAHVRARVKALRSARIAREVTPAPGYELADSPVSYRAALAGMVKRIGDGFATRLAIAGPAREGPPPQAFTDAKEALAKPLTKQELAALQAAESRAERERLAGGGPREPQREEAGSASAE